MKDTNDVSLERRCGICEHAVVISDDNNVLCRKKGIVKSDYFCRRFAYDPLKHIPGSPPKLIIPGADELTL